MTTKHDPYENAVAERVNGTLKNEFDLEINYRIRRMQRGTEQSCLIYNNLRLTKAVII